MFCLCRISYHPAKNSNLMDKICYHGMIQSRIFHSPANLAFHSPNYNAKLAKIRV